MHEDLATETERGLCTPARMSVREAPSRRGRPPHRLPEVGAGLGRAMREFARARTEVVDSVVRSSSDATTEPVHESRNP